LPLTGALRLWKAEINSIDCRELLPRSSSRAVQDQVVNRTGSGY